MPHGIIPSEMNQIGQLNEQQLHAALKAHYAGDGAQTEVLVDGYIIDVVRDGLLFEIQNGNFSSIKKKLKTLVANHQVRLVYPVAAEKWLLKLPKKGGGGCQTSPDVRIQRRCSDSTSPKRRKSPKRGRLVDVFAELVSFPDLIMQPNFSLEVALIWEEEVRRYTGRKRWRRNGWETVDRRLLKVLEGRVFETPEQMGALLPHNLPEAFTTTDIAEGLEIPLWLAQKMAYCLREMGVITMIGKQSRSVLYTINR